jgi:hypothetical protein
VNSHTGGSSYLYELTITEILGRDPGYRGPNPLGHIGESKDYFAVHAPDRAYDYKRDAIYNARTYLLCLAGKRLLSDPSGSLSDAEVFIAWKTAKEEGLLPHHDPIPSRGLVHIARNHDLCTDAEIEDGWKLPLEVYWEAVSVVREEYRLHPGRGRKGVCTYERSNASRPGGR